MEGERNDAHQNLRSEGQLSRFVLVLELDGELQITSSAGEAIALTGEGARLRAEVASVPAVRPTLRLVSSSYKLVRRLAKILTRRELTLLVTSSGVPLVELGAAARGGVAERLLGMPHVRRFRRK